MSMMMPMPMPMMTMTAGYQPGTSTIKSLSFFLLFAGLVFVVIGYVRSNNSYPPPRVEFRYVPRTFEQEQDSPVPVMSVYGKMFSKRDPWSKAQGYIDTFPWERANINSLPVTDYTENGRNRAVGQQIIS